LGLQNENGDFTRYKDCFICEFKAVDLRTYETYEHQNNLLSSRTNTLCHNRLRFNLFIKL